MSEEKYSRPLTEFDYYVVKGTCYDVLCMSNDYTHALKEMKSNLNSKSLVRISETTLVQATSFKAMKGITNG